MSNKHLATAPKQTSLANLDQAQIDILRDTLFKGFTNQEMEFCVAVCNRTGLDPFSKQIFFQKRSNKIVIITGIDGFRLCAQRSGAYAGADDIIFDDEEKPNKATATVYKFLGGQRCPFTATVRWNEFYPGDAQGHMWRKMPTQMLGKCAEAQALRKGFPAELSGVYLKEEMEQADSDQAVIKTKAEEVTAELAKPVAEIIESKAQEFKAEDFFEDIPVEAVSDLGEYVVKIKQYFGKKLKDINPKDLKSLIARVEKHKDSQPPLHPDVVEFAVCAASYLAEKEVVSGT